MPSQTEKMGEWRIFDTAEAVAKHAAEWLCTLACACERDFAICLSGGSTPRRLYRHLGDDAIAEKFPWNCVHWFWGDERFVRHDDPNSNYRMAYDALFSRVPISKDRIHAIPTEGLSPDDAAANYQTLLKQYYGRNQLDPARPIFDVTLMGVGDDGHTASLFPGSPSLREKQRWVLPIVGEAREIRVTLTYPVFDSSRNLAFLVAGANKRDALAKIRTGDTEMPAASVCPVGNLYWFVDRAALPN